MDLSSSKSLLRSINRHRSRQSAADTPGAVPEPTVAALIVIEKIHAARCKFDYSQLDAVSIEIACSSISDLLTPASTGSPEWEYVALAALVLKDCISSVSYAPPGNELSSEKTLKSLISVAKPLVMNTFIDHTEPRVRRVGAELIGVMAAKLGPDYFDELAPLLSSQVAAFFERREVSREARLGSESEIALDDTTGWYSLESLLCSYRELVGGCGPALNYFKRVSKGDIELFIENSSSHINRYIRQATFELLHILMKQYSPGTLGWSEGEFVPLLSQCISNGLADNFSQVRFPATFAARYFLIAMNASDREKYVWPLLLPRVCLNRYYPADGVKFASLDLWREVTQGKGKDLVTQNLSEAYRYYASMVENKSHLICEAACWVLGELGTIIDANAIAPFLPGILDMLGGSLGDDSWQVRGAACVATGRVIEAHPKETCNAACDVFLPLWIMHLDDHIWSLRSDSAAALGIAMRSPIDRLSHSAIDASVNFLACHLSSAAEPKRNFSFIPESSSLFSFIKRKDKDDTSNSSSSPLAKPLPMPSTARSMANAAEKKRFGVVELRKRPGSVLKL